MKNIYRNWMRLSLAVFMTAFTAALYAQSTVSGTITDETGAALPGVSLLVKGTSTGTSTDNDGKYSISVPSDATLVISFIGYATQEVAVGSRSTIDVVLLPDVTALQEVVVTGYTTENRREVTGAVSTLKTRELVAVPSGNIEQQLQGRVPGVTVITNGQPGTTSVVRIRGFGGFGGNDPLVIVDGVPTTNTNYLSPNDIETTTVLKDAASASIYGARAANGVIVYTTKKGTKGGDGKLKISYDGVFGFTDPGKVDNILNPQETADWTWKAIRNTAFQLGETPKFDHPQYGKGETPVLPDYLAVGPKSGVVGSVDLAAEKAKYNVDLSKGAVYQVIKANKAGTNWWDAITTPGMTNRHSLSFAGGGDRSAFYASLSMQDQDGYFIHQNFKRYATRINSAFDVSNSVRVGENIQLTYLQIRGLMGGEGGRGASNDENDVLSAFRMPSIIPIYDEYGGYAGTAAKGFNNPRNPVASRDRAANNGGYGLQAQGNIFVEVDPVKNLTLRSSIGGGLFSSYTYTYNPPSYENSENNSSFTYSEFANQFSNWVFTNTANYKNKFDVHGIDLLAGVEALNTGRGRNINGSGLNPFNTDPNYINLNNTQSSGRVLNSGYGLGTNFFSVFGRLQYNYNEKYMINALIRRDGASRFGANNRYGIFPAFSAAWRISEEDFMSGLSFISDLKLRGGWGQMGNSNNVDPNNQYNLFAQSLGLSAYDIAGSNSGVTGGIYRSRIGNPNAKWETSETTNFGFDGSFLDGKLDVVFDWWQKDTRDLLYTLETPAVVGPLASDPAVNIAEMRNTGIDLEITSRGTVAGITFEARASGSFLHNEIKSLAPGVTYFDAGGTRNGNAIRNQIGRPISSFFGYKVLGLFQTQDEVNNAPAQDGKGLGRFRFADINGDNVVNADDRVYLGDPVPDFNGGINLKLNYKNFELETFLAVFLGVENYNFSKWFTDFYPSFTGAAIGNNVKNSWTPERGGNTVPIFENISNFSTNTQHNSYYVENGNYARLTNLQISYIFPSNALSRYGFERAKIYIQGTNLFTFSGYSGLDPGVAGTADTTLGLDIGTPPVAKGYNIGLSLGF
ncbi:SusC/RagA family TonB-linked outer membrane protein [Fulvivirgaceae bacterium PWU4]|uniref:SusC/RagA family TonB-linked outer membrane protein n=1 Tax=Chryseosolibacter histidini TaxID=2782349 RepID=A0AAP2DT12_9BACT|nr:SusC/RagA family TonB-linked outer membrane protein [Chryseosolibacter histidini]MBT1700667.1 SusC/RagA family TonB-linked outer membrane protein [Chryseosolibacter histidini]